MRFSFILVTGLLLGGCGSETPLDPSLAASGTAADRLVVMTQNLYPGFNADLVTAALTDPDPSVGLAALLAAVETLQRTSFPDRAAALADRIARERPHVIGLQEVFTIDVDLTLLGQPVVIHQDFLAILQDALAARGLHYTVAAQQQGVDAALPIATVRDYDVLLVDEDRVTLGPARGHNFQVNLGTVAQGVTIMRGWVAAEGTLDGTTYLFVSTHPESGAASPFTDIRAAQVAELMDSIGTASPVVLLGDLNDEQGSTMYQIVTGAGFTDLWRAMRPGAAGYTCCHADDLSDPVARFDQRIDYVFARDMEFRNGRVPGQITIIGDQPADRVSGPDGLIWWSDHAGLVATFLFPAATAKR
jgi:endonuclease/exonuclease/phosphatase family metal-dependent hydrolase